MLLPLIIQTLLFPNVDKKIHHFREMDWLGERLVSPEQTLVSCVPTYGRFSNLCSITRLFICKPLLPRLIPEKKTMIHKFSRIACAATASAAKGIKGLVTHADWRKASLGLNSTIVYFTRPRAPEVVRYARFPHWLALNSQSLRWLIHRGNQWRFSAASKTTSHACEKMMDPRRDVSTELHLQFPNHRAFNRNPICRKETSHGPQKWHDWEEKLYLFYF